MKIFFILYSLSFLTILFFYYQDNRLKESIKRGTTLYNKNCAACHSKDGTGKRKRIPPLAQSDYLLNKTEESIRGLKYGLKGEIIVNGITYDRVMKPSKLSDQEIADVMNFILNSWGNSNTEIITDTRVSKTKS